MSTLLRHNFFMDFIPGENFLFEHLQKPLAFILNNKVVKSGRLILYKRVHFYIQITIINSDNERENFDIPIPFKSEDYTTEGLLYYDYRLSSLQLSTKLSVTKKISSSYFNKILEISSQIN